MEGNITKVTLPYTCAPFHNKFGCCWGQTLRGFQVGQYSPSRCNRVCGGPQKPSAFLVIDSDIWTIHPLGSCLAVVKSTLPVLIQQNLGFVYVAPRVQDESHFMRPITDLFSNVRAALS